MDTLLAHAGGGEAVPLGVALLAVALLALATWAGGMAGRSPAAAGPDGPRLLAGALSAAFLLGVVVLTTAPAAVHAAAEAGVTGTLVLGLGLAGLGLALGADRAGGRGTRGWAGAGLVLHRLLEGAAVGGALLAGLRPAAVVVLALAVHGACEGFALMSYQTAAGVDGRRGLRRLAVLSASPVAAVLLTGAVAPPPALSAALLALLSGLLLGMSATLAPAALRRGAPGVGGKRPGGLRRGGRLAAEVR